MLVTLSLLCFHLPGLDSIPFSVSGPHTRMGLVSLSALLVTFVASI